MARKIGQGMKPRESGDTTEGEQEVVEQASTDEGQETVPADVPTEAEKPEQTSDTQEPVEEANVTVAGVTETEAGNLEELMKESIQTLPMPEIPKEVFQTLELVQKEMERVSGGAPATITGGYDIQIEGDSVKFFSAGIGERPDGSYGLVITVPEGYIEAIRQEAESNKETPEEWASTRFGEYLESWFQPAKAK